eukprot:6214508-Pleurochrysis_carterae.AAC.5
MTSYKVCCATSTWPLSSPVNGRKTRLRWRGVAEPLGLSSPGTASTLQSSLTCSYKFTYDNPLICTRAHTKVSELAFPDELDA